MPVGITEDTPRRSHFRRNTLGFRVLTPRQMRNHSGDIVDRNFIIAYAPRMESTVPEELATKDDRAEKK